MPRLPRVACMAAACRAAAPAPDPSQYIAQRMADGGIPGLSAAAVRGDDVVWHGGFGSAWPERGGDAHLTTPHTAFTFASVSKTITGVAALVLRDRGLVDLDADVDAYLPFAVARPGITLAQLMTHTSSVVDSYYWTIPQGDLYVDGDPAMSLADFNAAMFAASGKWYSPRTFSGAPGQRFEYSNVGSSLAAGVVGEVARAHGLAADYDAFVRQHIFAPLGAAHGSHYLRDFDGGMAPPVGALPSELVRGAHVSWPHYSVPDYPNGFWRSSAEVYARMLGMVASGGVWKGVRVLSNGSASFIRERADVQGGRDQGRAFFHYFGELLGHEGGELGIATTAQFDPSTGVGAVVLTNGDWCQGAAFEDALLGVQAHLLAVFGARAAHNASAAPSALRDSARRKARCRGRHQRHPHSNQHW